MPNQINLSKLSLVICPTKFPRRDFSHIHEQTFRFWWSNWQKAYKDLNLNQKLFSDIFTRQDFTGNLFFEKECIGQVCYRVVDAASTPTRLDSYFKNWSDESFSVLASNGSRVLVTCFLSVAENYRGHEIFGIAVKDILMGFSSFLNDQQLTTSVAAAPRKNRNVNRTCTDWGGVVVESDVPSGYGDLVDLVVFGKNFDATTRKHPHFSEINSIWKKKIIIPTEESSQYLSMSA